MRKMMGCGLLAYILAAAVCLWFAPQSFAQGGEPMLFAIRGAKVVPVSGPPVEDATVVISHGVITAVGKGIVVPAEAWVIEGKGLTVYPGLIDSFTDVGLTTTAPGPVVPGGPGAGGPQPQQIPRGPEDRPATTPWRSAADDANAGDKRLETWRGAGFTTVVSAPKGGIFPGLAALLNTAGDRAGDLVIRGEVAVPLSLTLNPAGGSAGFPGSLMGVLTYVRQV